MAEQTILTSDYKGVKFASVSANGIISSNPTTLVDINTLSTYTEKYSNVTVNGLVPLQFLSSGISLSIQVFRPNRSDIDLEKFRDASDTYFSTGGSGSGSNQFWS